MIHRFRKVTEGLYRGSAPSPEDVLWLKENFNINKIISLDEQAGINIDRATKMLGIKHIMLPIDISNLRQTLFNLFNRNLKDLLINDGPTYIHCAAGKDRTGFVVAVFKCKYMGMKPEKAIEEAKSLGFGLDVDPNMIALFEKLIRGTKSVADENSADIVSNEREYISDNRSGPLDEGHQGSFSPYLSTTRQYPVDSVYNYINDQSDTRENYGNKAIKENKVYMPQVGVYDNNAGIHGAGPTEPVGGFISE